MTSEEWDASDDPQMMIRAAGNRVSPRKWRLAGVAASRAARRHHLVQTVTDTLTLAERMADGFVPDSVVTAAKAVLRLGWDDTELGGLLVDIPPPHHRRLPGTVFGRIPSDAADKVMWLREVVGNPFRWQRWEDEWVSPTVHTLAAEAYAAGRFDSLPVIADAVEDAGCDNPELLAHLRGPGPHCRGCWALDLILGKV